MNHLTMGHAAIEEVREQQQQEQFESRGTTACVRNGREVVSRNCGSACQGLAVKDATQCDGSPHSQCRRPYDQVSHSTNFQQLRHKIYFYHSLSRSSCLFLKSLMILSTLFSILRNYLGYLLEGMRDSLESHFKHSSCNSWETIATIYLFFFLVVFRFISIKNNDFILKDS